MPTVHQIKFERNTRSGQWRALCTCGWFWIGDEAEVQSRAASHDMDWQPATPANTEAAQ